MRNVDEETLRRMADPDAMRKNEAFVNEFYQRHPELTGRMSVLVNGAGITPMLMPFVGHVDPKTLDAFVAEARKAGIHVEKTVIQKRPAMPLATSDAPSPGRM